MTKNTEAIVKGISQAAWEESMKESGMDKLSLTKDSLSLMRIAFELGHNSGQTAMMDTLRELYYQDEFLLEDFFEINSDIVH